MAAGLLLAPFAQRALAPLSDARRAGRRRQRLHGLYRASRCSCRTGSCAGAAWRSSIAFAGVGVGSIVLLPWLQSLIERAGWRAACLALGIAAARRAGAAQPAAAQAARGHRPAARRRCRAAARPPRRPRTSSIPPGPRSTGRCARAMRTARFWWIALAYFCALFSWYAVQVHQTKYLVEIGFSPTEAAWALGLVSLVAVPGRSRSATSPTGSAGNGSGPSPALGFAICFPRADRAGASRYTSCCST